MKRIPWKVLDACGSADAVAKVLKAAGVKGRTKRATDCPLALATGWTVYTDLRAAIEIKCFEDNRLGAGPLVRETRQPLTPAECTFVSQFDNGLYPELVKK